MIGIANRKVLLSPVSRGFTLIEMMVTLSIAALLLTIVPPMFSGGVSSTALKAAARELAATLRQARSHAILKRKETVVTLDVGQKQYSVIGKVNARQLPDKVELSIVTAKTERFAENKANIRFFPNGSATGGQITLAGGKQKYVIDINWLTGRVAVFD